MPKSKPTKPAKPRDSQKDAKPKFVYNIHVHVDEDYAGEVEPKLLRDAAKAALKQQAATPGSLTIAVSGDETLHALNKQHLGHDQPTDVLSFPSDRDDPDDTGRYFGDIVISYPRAMAQADTGGHAVEAELQLLTVHGVLHLLGHDHASDEERAQMWQAQADVLEALGSEITGPQE
jgi:probable rRNA maturation factor